MTLPISARELRISSFEFLLEDAMAGGMRIGLTTTLAESLSSICNLFVETNNQLALYPELILPVFGICIRMRCHTSQQIFLAENKKMAKTILNINLEPTG